MTKSRVATCSSSRREPQEGRAAIGSQAYPFAAPLWVQSATPAAVKLVEMSVVEQLDLFWDVAAVHRDSRFWRVCEYFGRIRFVFCWKNTDQAETGALERVPRGVWSMTLNLLAPILYPELRSPTTDLSLLHEAEFAIDEKVQKVYTREMLEPLAKQLNLSLAVAPRELAGETCVIEDRKLGTFSPGVNPHHELFADRYCSRGVFQFASLWEYPSAFDSASACAAELRRIKAQS